MSLLDKLYKLLFPRQFARRLREKEEEIRQAHWDKLAEEEYRVWQQGGKQAWRAWRIEQTRKRVAAQKLLPQNIQDMMNDSLIDREIPYPPRSPEERKRMKIRD